MKWIHNCLQTDLFHFNLVRLQCLFLKPQWLYRTKQQQQNKNHGIVTIVVGRLLMQELTAWHSGCISLCVKRSTLLIADQWVAFFVFRGLNIWRAKSCGGCWKPSILAIFQPKASARKSIRTSLAPVTKAKKKQINKHKLIKYGISRWIAKLRFS